MIFHRLILRISQSLISRLYKAEQEIARLEERLERSSKQEKLLEKMVSDTYQQGAELIRSLAKSLDECNRQRFDLVKKYAIQGGQISKLQDLASRDPLTELLNRRGFEKALHRQISLIQRYTRDNAAPFHSPYMILLDLDKFKEVNDTYGHQKGDEVLLVVTEILSEVFHRDTDIVCRTGGDEFLICLSNSTQEQAVVRAELLRKKIEDEKRLHFSKHSVTASIGVTMADIIQDTKPDEMDSVCQRATTLVDRALYHSKELGRNAVTIAIGDTLYIL